MALSVGERVGVIMGITPWVEALRVADALGDVAAVDQIRVIIVKKIMEMYTPELDQAISSYNAMMLQGWPGLDHIRSTEVAHVRAGL